MFRWRWTGCAALVVILLGAGPCPAADIPAELAACEGLINAGKFADGLAEAGRIARQAEAAGDSLSLAVALLRVSDAHYYLGQRDSTLAPMLRALELYQGLQDLEGIGRTYYSLAYYYEKTDPDRMIELLEQGLPFAEEADDQRLIMNINNAMGVAHWNHGQYGPAIAAFEESSRLAEQLGLTQALASATQNLALIHLNQGNPLLALEYFERALAAFRQSDSTHSLAVALGNSGNSYYYLHRYEKAMACYEEALAIHRQNGYLRGQAINLDNIARLHQTLQEWDQARQVMEQGLSLYEQIEDTRSTILGYLALGLMALEQGHRDGARPYLEKANQLGQEFGDPYLQSAVEGALAQLAWEENDLRAMERWLNQAEAHAHEVESANYLGGIDFWWARLAARQGNLDLAVAKLEQAIALYDTGNLRNRTYLWHTWLARFLAARGDQDGARSHFETGLQLIEQLDTQIDTDRFRVGFFREVAEVYHHYAAWLGRRGEPGTAVAVLDRGRARVLALRLAREDRSEAAPPPAAEPAVKLPEPGVLQVTYSVQEDTLLVFSLGANRQGYRTVPQANELLERARLFGELVAGPDAAAASRAAGRRLCAELLGPELAADRYRRLCLSPDADLWALPFCALVTSRDAYLSQDMTVTLTPSWGILDRQSARNPARGSQVLVLGNSRFDGVQAGGQPLAELADSRREAKSVASHFPDAMLLLDADEARFKSLPLADFRLLHLATHTLIDLGNPLNSSIVLAPSATDDGLLQTREIYDLPLGCDLAVVSACRSGRGPIVAGEGLLGVAHSLMSAGCGAVLLSRWDVADDGAAHFMEVFYDALGDRTPAAALAVTQQRLRDSEQWSHPTHWAGFFLAGDGDRMVGASRAAGPVPLRVWAPAGAVLLLVLTVGGRRRAKRRAASTHRAGNGSDHWGSV